MSLQAKTFLNFLAGAVAGVLAWALTDLTGWFADTLGSLHPVGPGLPGYGKYLLYGALFGLILGVLLGVVEALSLDSQRQMWTTLGLGAVIGFSGGGLGLHIGQFFYGLLGGQAAPGAAGSPIPFFIVLI